MPPFHCLDETGLGRLEDDALVDYMRRARVAGDPSAGLALSILVHGHWHNVVRRVRLKVPEQHVEDLAGDIVVDAISSSFDGSSVGQFQAWLNTIVQRAIADFFRRGPGRITIDPGEGPEPAVAGDAGVVELVDVVDRVMERLRPEHRRVVEIMLFEGGTAVDAARGLPGMSEDNAHQICSRFRRALRRELGDDSEGG